MEEFLIMPDDFDEHASNENEEIDSPFQKLHKLMNDPEFWETIKQPVNKTKGELLMI